MLKYIKSKMSAIKNSNIEDIQQEEVFETPVNLRSSLKDNMVLLREKFDNSGDFLSRELKIYNNTINIIGIEGMINFTMLSDLLMGPLMSADFSEKTTPEDIYSYLETKMITSMDLTDVYTTDDIFTFSMSGFIIILIDGIAKGVCLGAQGFNFRSISEPSSEVNIRGSREGFTEPLRINMTMVRRRIKSPKLKFELFNVGSKSKTSVCMMYMTDTVSKKMVREIRHKIRHIDIDVVLESGYIQPFLEGKPFSIFSEVGTTERPDTVCAKINEGRVAILVDGTPFALIVPYLFSENFQSFDDYCHRPYYTSFMRIIKYISFAFTILLPGLYVAIGSFHPELFPHSILFNIATSQEATPFPLVIEALLIHFIYEVMREAGLRLPRPVGHAVSIVGALVIGDAAVTAGLIGAPMVMVVAVTAISSFVVPSIYEPVSILRFGFIIVGGTFGLYGIGIAVAALLINICSLSEYGVIYTAPISPFSFKAMKDVFVRFSWKKMNKNVNIKNLTGVDMQNSGGENS